MELDSTTMFTPVTSAVFIRSTGEPALPQVLWRMMNSFPKFHAKGPCTVHADVTDACEGVQNAIYLLNRCLARTPDVSFDHHDVLQTTLQMMEDLSGLLKLLLMQSSVLCERPVGDWLLITTNDDSASLHTPLSPVPAVSSSAPRSAHEIVWGTADTPRGASDEHMFGRNSSFSLSMSLSGRSDDREAVRRILSDGHAPFAGDGNGSDLGDSRCRRQSLPCGVLPAGAVFEGFAEEHDWAHVSQEHWHDLHPPSERRDSDPATPDRQLLDLFATQGALVKTIKNNEWDQFLAKLLPADGAAGGHKTSLTLVPPHGRFMRLYGTEASRCAGLVWDRALMDLTDCWAWPSGYYAKTEFNIDGKGRLKNGRQEALVSVDDLLAANAAYTSIHAFNELYPAADARALAGLFCRTPQYQHLLFCMGLRDMLEARLCRRLPIVLLDPVNGARPFGPPQQLRLLQLYVAHAKPLRNPLSRPCEFIDLTPFPEVSEEDTIVFHGLYGVAQPCLRRVIEQQNVPVLQDLILLGLASAVSADNVPAARELVRCIFHLTITHPGLGSMYESVRNITMQAQSAQVLVPIGAYALLCAFVSGHSHSRTLESCQVLDDWIQQSSSLAFRMQSWKSLRDKHRASGSSEPGSNMMTFLGHKAIQNRRLFLEALQDQLAKASGVTSFLMRLCSLVARLQHPCLRLQLLQYITGVDERFVVDLFKQTCEFAFQCVAEA